MDKEERKDKETRLVQQVRIALEDLPCTSDLDCAEGFVCINQECFSLDQWESSKSMIGNVKPKKDSSSDTSETE